MNDKLAQIKQTISATASPDLQQIRDWTVQLEILGNTLTPSQKQHDVLAALLTANDVDQTTSAKVNILITVVAEFEQILVGEGD